MKYILLLCLFAYCAAITVPGSENCTPHPIPSIHVIAKSHYDYGYQIGSTFASFIRNFASTSNVQKLVSYVNSPEGRIVYDKFLYTQNTSLSMYVDEIRGYADGSGVDFRTLMAVNMAPEISLILKAKNPEVHMYGSLPDSLTDCTDVLINSIGSARSLSHNEDGNLEAINAYIVHAKIAGSVPFVAYVYPGYLAGNAFSYNGNGVAVTTNALPPTDVIIGGMTRYFINRYVIEASSMKDVVQRVQRFTCAIGFNTNAGEINSNSLITIEKWHDQQDILELKGTVCPTVYGLSYYEHYNMYLRMNVSQFTDNSSVHRKARGDSYGSICANQEALKVLGDTVDSIYPIYRVQNPPDTIATLATAHFDFSTHKVNVYSSNPGFCPSTMTMDMLDV